MRRMRGKHARGAARLGGGPCGSEIPTPPWPAPRGSGETTHRPITQALTRDSALALALGIERRIMDPERSPVAYLPEAPATWGGPRHWQSPSLVPVRTSRIQVRSGDNVT